MKNKPEVAFLKNTPEQRAARLRFIVAHRADRFSYKYIALMLGVTPERVRQLYAQALEKGYINVKIK